VDVAVFVVALSVSAWAEYQALRLAAGQATANLAGRMVVFGAGVGVTVIFVGLATTLSGGHTFDAIIASVVLVLFAALFTLVRVPNCGEVCAARREEHAGG
jgi:hypothetical protein